MRKAKVNIKAQERLRPKKTKALCPTGLRKVRSDAVSLRKGRWIKEAQAGGPKAPRE